MPWFKVDDNLAFHHKTVAAGVSAMGLWVRAGSWCAQTLTDGFVPEHMVPALADGDAGLAGRLVEAGLWRRVKGGFVFHEWAQRQPSRQSIENLRTSRAAAGRNGGLKSGQVRQGKRSKHEASASSKPEASASQVLEPPSRPVPSPSSGYAEENTQDRASEDHSPPAAQPSVGRGPAPSGPNAVLAQRAVAAAGIGGKFGQSTVNRLAHEAAKLLDGGVEGTDVSAGLIRWKGSPGKGAGLLAELVNDVIREREFPPTRHLRAVNAVPVSNAPCGDYWQD